MAYVVWYQSDFNTAATGNLSGQDAWTHPVIGNPLYAGPSSQVVSYGGGQADDIGFDTGPYKITPYSSLMSRFIGKPANITNYYVEFELDLQSFVPNSLPYFINAVIRPGYGDWSTSNSPWSVFVIERTIPIAQALMGFMWRDKNMVQHTQYFPLIDITLPHIIKAETKTELVGVETIYNLYFYVDSIQQLVVEVSNNAFDVNQFYTCTTARGVVCSIIVDDIDIQYEYVVPARPKAPTNVNVVARQNYNVLWWDAVTVDENNVPISGGIQGYRVYKSTTINESDLTLAKTITTVDANGVVDTAYLDTAQDEISVYKVASFDVSM